MTIAIIITHATASADHNSTVAERAVIVYQLENDVYEEYSFAKRRLYETIEQFNSRLAANKERSHNIWINVWFPAVWDDIELIHPEVYVK